MTKTECSGATSCPAVVEIKDCQSQTGETCPAVQPIDDGDFYVIGYEADDYPVPEGLHVGEGERAVIVPRYVFLKIAGELLAEVDDVR